MDKNGFVHPDDVCKCGHERRAHAHSTGAGPCGAYDCGCPAFDDMFVLGANVTHLAKSAKEAGVVYRVDFHPDDFRTVAACAESLGLKIGEFIRNAALQAAAFHGYGLETFTTTTSGGAQVVWGVAAYDHQQVDNAPGK